MDARNTPPDSMSAATIDEVSSSSRQSSRPEARSQPATAFAEWLGLLKELNSRHAHGAMPTPLFHELNTCLLDLIPGREPARA